MRPLLCLTMIVRDEAHCLARTFASVRGVVDRWCVLDTGSEDGTQEVVQNALATEEGPVVDGKYVPLVGRLYEAPFEDYAESRNLALDCEEHGPEVLLPSFSLVKPPKPPNHQDDASTWALSLSADETLHNGEALRAFLQSYDGEETAFLVEVCTPTGAHDFPRVLRVGGPWRYEGEIHEVPVHQGDRSRAPAVKVPGCWIEYAPTDPARLARRLREVDLPLLTRQLAEAKTPDDRARVVVHLAQAREHLAAAAQGDVAAASQEAFSALGWYAYLSMDGEAPSEARRRAAWKYLNVAEMLGVYLPHEMVPRLQHVMREEPENPEVAYMLARHLANVDGDGVVRGDARAGMQAAQRAAKLARDAVADPGRPHDPHGLLWRSHFIAATCARALGHGPAARRSAEAGVAGGAPEGVFEQFLK